MHNKKRRFCIVIAVSAVSLFMLVALQCGREDNQFQKVSETRFVLDTYATITLNSDVPKEIFNGDVPKEIFNGVFDLIEELEDLFSITRENSDVYRINSSNGKTSELDTRTIELIRGSIDFAVISNGLFDITVGRLTRLWNFAETTTIPSEDEIKEALETVNFRNIVISGNSVTLSNKSSWIDLGAIAKGYIADQVVEFLMKNGVTNAMIDLGGDIRLVGDRGDGSPWRIAIRNPFIKGQNFLGVLEAADVAIISSGIYERNIEVDGVVYHHIIDPRTGFPVQSDIISATVIAKNGVAGEGLSTLAILMGSEAIKNILLDHPKFIGAVLVLDNGEVLEVGDVRLYR